MSIQFFKTIKSGEYMTETEEARVGFTLMEVLVATSVFVILALMILTINVSVLHNSQKTLAYSRIQRDAQVVMETLAKKIRTSRVDYNYAGYDTPIINPEDELALIDLTGARYVFALNDGALTVAVDGGNFQAIPAQNIVVSNLKFYIQPATYPFNINYPPETQPRVTMVITFTSSQGDQQASLTVQQTVPQRSGGEVE